MKHELKVGQKVYLKPVNNAARHSNEIVEAEIIKVGRKYFEVDKGYHYSRKYHISDLKQATDMVADYEVYMSKQEILDEREINSLYFEIGKKFRGVGTTLDLTLSQLRRIKEIISE